MDILGKLSKCHSPPFPLSFTYNNAGQLAEVRLNGVLQASYLYNAQGSRTRKSTASGTTVYHYDLKGRLIAETQSDGTMLRAYVWTEDAPIAQIDRNLLGQETVLYLHTDHQGTPRLATNQGGTVVWRWVGSAFGDIGPNEDPDNDGNLTTVNLRYDGQYFDSETGLHHNWHRYYDLKTGRYISSDPIGLAGGLNSYAYVNNNPLSFVDPLGLSPLNNPVERHILAHASRGNWAEVENTINTLTNLGEKELAQLYRQCASKRGGELLKTLKDSGAGTGARSGQHGVPYSRAGAELAREANKIQNPILREAMKTQAERLIQQGRGISHY